MCVCVCVCVKIWIESDRTYVEKSKNRRKMFDGSFIVVTHFDFKVLSEYKNMLSN